MNRLARETSPYLRQHADNPVDWYPWGEEAIGRARAEERPILLSIGYSSCHWCHVMAHESFEDGATAEVMNQRFINIKVDREERPDVDQAYQTAHRLLTRQSGGWPLTAFLDPDTLLPFFAGTYFPRSPRYGLPGFSDLLRRVGDVFEAKRDELRQQGDKLASLIGTMENASPEAGAGDRALLAAAREQLAERYDASEGGFGGAPKFPMPATLDRLLRHWAHSRAPAKAAPGTGPRLVSGIGRGQPPPDRQALDMVMTTLTKIARGGVYDHIGGGFYRYATDRRWAIPHFEKMLYDNGALMALYADALALGPDPLFTGAVRETAAWMTREMQHPDGGYYTSQDADSEGEEGKYYVWRRDAMKRLLTEEEYLVVETLYGLDKPANFNGRWNLHRRDAWRAVVERLYLQPDAAEALLASAKAKLAAARRERQPPAKDDKVLSGWNGLAIRGMAKAGVRLGEPQWIDSAARAADFVRIHMVADGRLYATWKEGTAKHPGYLDDHANMLQGLLSLLSSRWRDEDMTFALFLGDELLNRFEDRESGGFYFTAHDHEKLIHRPKPLQDDALPPGNATAAQALLGLGHLTAESRYLAAAERTLSWMRGFVEQQPAGHCAALTALEETVHPPELVILRGPEDALSEWLAIARAGYRPTRSVYGIGYDATRFPSYLPRLVSADNRARVSAFFCSGLRCSPPMTDIDAFAKEVSRSP